MKKNICVIMPSYWDSNIGGAEIQSALIFKNILERHQLFFLGRKVSESTHNNGIQVIDINSKTPLSRYSAVFDGHNLFRELDDIRPDIIYQRVGGAYTGLAARYCRSNPCKLIWHISSNYDVFPFNFKLQLETIFRYIDKKLLEYGIRHANFIIGQTKQQEMMLWSNYHRTCDIIVPNSHPAPRYEIKKSKPVKIFWIANFKVLKQPEIFIRLVENLKVSTEVEFIMVGRAGNNKWALKILDEVAHRESLQYRGELPHDEVNRLLSIGHILVNTSEWEGFPNTFIQAWMRKVPVVSLNVDPDNVIKEHGIGFHSGNMEQLISDVKKLIENDVLREEMGKRAQEYALENHSLKNIDQIIRFIEKI